VHKKELEYLEKYKKEVMSLCKCKGRDMTCSCYQKYFNLVKKIRAGIPLQFVNWNLNNLDNPQARGTVKEVEEYIEFLKDNYERGKGLYIHGIIGNGKTTLASIVLNYAIDLGYSGSFMTLDQCMNLLRGREEGTVVSEVKLEIEDIWVDFLVIDELNNKYNLKPTASVRSTLEELLRSRSNRLLPTIITSNSTKAILRSDFGDKIESLVSAYCREIKTKVEFDVREGINREKKEEK